LILSNKKYKELRRGAIPLSAKADSLLALFFIRVAKHTFIIKIKKQDIF
jgi:hypothetical protein